MPLEKIQGVIKQTQEAIPDSVPNPLRELLLVSVSIGPSHTRSAVHPSPDTTVMAQPPSSRQWVHYNLFVPAAPLKNPLEAVKPRGDRAERPAGGEAGSTQPPLSASSPRWRSL